MLHLLETVGQGAGDRPLSCGVSKLVVASYCRTFLKPEMLHVYRQVTGLRRFDTFVLTAQRQSAERYPFEPVEVVSRPSQPLLRRFWLKYVKRTPKIVYRGMYDTLVRILDRRRAEMLHIYFGHSGVDLLPFIERWPRPCVVSFHGMDVMHRDDQPGYLDRLRELVQVLPLVLVRSESLGRRLVALGCPPERLRLNRTGIPLESFPAIERVFPREGAWRLVQACRLIEKKGLPTSLRAFALFAREHPRARFVIAGSGAMRGELERLADELGVRERVDFAGFLGQENLRRLYAGAHLFLHPSQLTEAGDQEGVPNSMLEAMATGLPVVATRHGGIPEAVRHGENGLLVAERNHQALADALFALAGDPDRWAALGREASASVRREFELGRQIERLEGFYLEALGHAG